MPIIITITIIIIIIKKFIIINERHSNIIVNRSPSRLQKQYVCSYLFNNINDSRKTINK